MRKITEERFEQGKASVKRSWFFIILGLCLDQVHLDRECTGLNTGITPGHQVTVLMLQRETQRSQSKSKEEDTHVKVSLLRRGLGPSWLQGIWDDLWFRLVVPSTPKFHCRSNRGAENAENRGTYCRVISLDPHGGREEWEVEQSNRSVRQDELMWRIHKENRGEISDDGFRSVVNIGVVKDVVRRSSQGLRPESG